MSSSNSHPSPEPAPDAAAIEAWCKAAGEGDRDALERLLGCHHGRLLGFVRRKVGTDWQGKIDPEDILQQAYVEVFSAIASFSYSGEDSFYRWASRILDHTFIDAVRHLRRKKRDVAREVGAGQKSSSGREGLLEQVLRDTTTPSRIMRRADAAAAMLACMAQLPEDYRSVVQRLYLDEEPLATIAADMGRSEDAIRRLAGRAVAQLANCVGRASRYFSLSS